MTGCDGCGDPFELVDGRFDVYKLSRWDYTIDISGQSYDEVVSAFGWAVTDAPVNNTEVVFYIDDIVWR